MATDQCQDAQSQLKTRSLIYGEITYEQALDNDNNMIPRLGYRDQKLKLYIYLNESRKQIKNTVAHHLGVPARKCRIAAIEDWIHGSFNLCLRIDIDTGIQSQLGDDNLKQVMIRFPLPYRIGEDPCPGNSDEKPLCEAATYAWLQENCPTIPIPQLYGFALSNGQTFTFLENLPILNRCFQRVRRRVLHWLGFPTPSLYVPHRRQTKELMLETPYLLIEYIKPSRGKMLANTWTE